MVYHTDLLIRSRSFEAITHKTPGKTRLDGPIRVRRRPNCPDTTRLSAHFCRDRGPVQRHGTARVEETMTKTNQHTDHQTQRPQATAPAQAERADQSQLSSTAASASRPWRPRRATRTSARSRPMRRPSTASTSASSNPRASLRRDRRHPHRRFDGRGQPRPSSFASSRSRHRRTAAQCRPFFLAGSPRSGQEWRRRSQPLRGASSRISHACGVRPQRPLARTPRHRLGRGNSRERGLARSRQSRARGGQGGRAPASASPCRPARRCRRSRSPAGSTSRITPAT